MVNDKTMVRTRTRLRGGFTLIELLVVVAIIALLVSILLPALGNARKSAYAAKCGANMKSVGQAFGIYLAENNAVFPPSYIYPRSADGDYRFKEQPADHPYGYMHWSWFLFNRGAVKAEAFTCPAMRNGGHPRTNPGPRGSDWEQGQQKDQDGNTNPNSKEDRQAPRMAFTANAAIVPRNKFTSDLAMADGGASGQTWNRFVQEHEIMEPRPVILATEFHDDWRAACKAGTPEPPYLSKSHRPLTAFWGMGCKQNEYAAIRSEVFRYGNPALADYGLLKWTELQQYIVGIIDAGGRLELNAVGRHHTGRDNFGGSTNFLYTDGHVARKFIIETLRGREWGSKYYSLVGPSNLEVVGDE